MYCYMYAMSDCLPVPHILLLVVIHVSVRCFPVEQVIKIKQYFHNYLPLLIFLFFSVFSPLNEQNIKGRFSRAQMSLTS